VAGSACYTAQTWEKMMTIFAHGKIRLAELITAKVPILRWQEAFNICTDRKG
jgi:L-iditol 2-dehydrogenase